MKIYLCFLGGFLTRLNPAKCRLPGLQWSRMISQDESVHRVSPLGIQMLSKPHYEHLFKGEKGNNDSQEAIEKSINHLKEHGLWEKKRTTFPEVNIKLPPLYGQNIDDHFRIIAGVQSQDYLDLAMQLIRTTLLPMPKQWSKKEGWTKYDIKTGKAKSVPCPSDRAIVLDVETCVTDSPRPIMAVAVSPHGWYSWVSKRLFSSHDFFNKQNTNLDDLIPLEVPEGEAGSLWTEGRLVVGHSVCYDRARIKEQYLIKGPNTKFLDTLSLHVCVSGLTTAQKGLWLSHKKKLEERDPVTIGMQNSVDKNGSGVETDSWLNWISVGSVNNLVDVHTLHVKNGRVSINKKLREVFVDGSIQDIRDDFQNLMQYCANDVFATHEILVQLLPHFLSRCPHPVTFAGMFEMGSSYLPLNSSWKQYIDDSEFIYQELQKEMKSKLIALANEACCYFHDERYMNSPWLCNLDWTTKKYRGKNTPAECKQLTADIEAFYLKEASADVETEEDKYKYLISSFPSVKKTKCIPHLPNYPEWYRNLCMNRSADDWEPGPVNISAQMRVTPYILRMKWNGHPLYYHSKCKWGYIVDPDLPAGKSPKPTNSESDSLENWNWSVVDNPQETLEKMDDLIMSAEWDSNLDEIDVMMKKKYRNVKKNSHENPMVKEANRCNWKEMGGEWGQSTEEEQAKDRWMPEVVVTPWGLTNDVVTLPNNKKYYFFRLPHKHGPQYNVGSPLSKDFLHKMEDGTLTSAAGRLGQCILIINTSISFWRMSRKRIMNQFVVGLDPPSSSTEEPLDPQYAVVPLTLPAGTVTRRAVEATWLTASNAKEGRVGSELKNMVRAPLGYHIVGADVDSQELWIAAILGDMHFTGIHGSTGIGWMLVQGNKTDESDVHSNTARTIGVSRNDAKVLNYGRIYGAGKPFIELLLKKFDPSLTNTDLEAKGDLIINATKGKRVFNLSSEGKRLATNMDIPLVDGNISFEDWRLICSSLGYFRAMKLLKAKVWVGGTESHLFNELESIVMSPIPKTPVLGCHITQTLETERIGKNYMTSRVNWVVQSSAVDYLHLMLVCTRWLFEKYEIDGRFCISIHDEVRYLVKSEDRYRAALALHLSNLFTRAMFAYHLGMHDLPQSVAFFSAVDVDKILRKEPKMDCVTPSNPLGLEKGHGIPLGETLDIYETLCKTNGSLKKASPKRSSKKHPSSVKTVISHVQ